MNTLGRMNLSAFGVFAVSTVFFFTGIVAAHAESPQSGTLMLRPAKIEAELSPGESKTIEVTIQNGTPAPVSVRVGFEDVAARVQLSPADDPVELLGSTEGTHTLRGMLSVSKPTFDLLSGEEVRIPLTIQVPKGVLPGGRYGSVVLTVSSSLKEGEAPASVALESRLAALLYVRISGSAHEEGKLAAFSLFNNAHSIVAPSASNPVKFQVAFQNTGDVYLNPHGVIALTDMWNKSRAITIDPWAVLPGATRMREIDWNDTLPVGRYSAHLTLARGYADAIDREVVTFWVLPTPMIASLWLLGFICFLWLARRSFRLSKNFLRV